MGSHWWARFAQASIIVGVVAEVVAVAHNPESRNFTQAVLGRAYTSTPLKEVERGLYKAKIEPPEQGYTAYYVEMHYPSGINEPFKFSTGVKVVPDVTEYEWKFTPDNSRR